MTPGAVAEVAIHVDCTNYGVVEDLHQAIMHALAQYIRQSRMTAGRDLGECVLNHDRRPKPRCDAKAGCPMLVERSRPARMRVAINLLTENPEHPSGAHWFWTRVIPEMAKRLEPGEELHLLVSPKSRHLYQGYGPDVSYITYPWSNERRTPRTLSEHLYSPLRLPLSRIDVFNTLMAPLVNIPWSLVIHMKTMHAFTAPDSLTPLARAYRRMNYPRSARAADAIIINSESLRSEVERYLEVDERKLKLIYEAVDHDLFKPGDAGAARAHVAVVRRNEAVRAVRVLAVAVQELRRVAAGLGAGPRRARGPPAGDRRRRARREVRRLAALARRPNSGSRETSSSSAGFRSRRPSVSTGRPTCSCTRR